MAVKEDAVVLDEGGGEVLDEGGGKEDEEDGGNDDEEAKVTDNAATGEMNRCPLRRVAMPWRRL